MMGLTKRQRECLNFLRAQVKEKGVAPTLNQIAAVMGWKSKTGAHHCLAALQARGYITVRPTFARAITLLPAQYDHGPDCLCERCPARRLQYEQIIQGLQCSAEFPSSICLIGLRPVSNITRIHWQRGFPLNSVGSRSRPAVPTEVRR